MTEQKLIELLRDMSLEEKVNQMSQSCILLKHFCKIGKITISNM